MTRTIYPLLRAKQAKNNEFYTLYDDVKIFVENTLIKDYLKDKIVYLPCDTEDSNIYKYLVDNKDALQIKEILRTSDDYYGHEDLYEKCDVIFTNPPFTGITKWFNWLNDNNIKYISWFPMASLYSWPEIIKYNKFIGLSGGGNIHTIIDNYTINLYRTYNFDTPDGPKGVNVFIVSNDDYFNNYRYIGKALKLNFDKAKDKLFMTENGYYEVYNSILIPNDYYEPLYIAVTAYIGKQHLFDLLEVTAVKGKDGKVRPRALVKLKDKYRKDKKQ